MMEVHQIKIPVKDSKQDLYAAAQKVLKTKQFKVEKVIRRSIDARDKENIKYIYSLLISLPTAQAEKKLLQKVHNNNIMLSKQLDYRFPNQGMEPMNGRPVIVGFGPAGMFCGLMLARQGYRPIILERGLCVEDRIRAIDDFWGNGKLNPSCNVQFGEGGAGTFSDGKLNTQVKDKYGRIPLVLQTFVAFGAPEEILYEQKPHIGTNLLQGIVKNIRKEIERFGGEVRFSSKLEDYTVNEDHQLQLTVNQEKLNTSCMVLAIGHSARDTFQMLYDHALSMEAKPFAIGLRIEHPAAMIHESMYGCSKEAKMLPNASYSLRHQASNGRSVYSFCMCPGGYVVNAASEDQESVVNGMSYSGRDGINSNSAIVVNVTPEDFDDTNPLSGVAFQRKWEQAAYQAGDGNIPVQIFADLQENQCTTQLGEITPQIKGKYTLSNLNDCLPPYVIRAIIDGVLAFERNIKGFAREDALLSGVETRTSSPVRIVRTEDYLSESNTLIYPCGEGAGYAGGITSAAVDGIKVAEAIISKYKPMI